MKKILKLALFLAIICAIAGVSLAYVNSITAPLIIAQDNLQAEKALKEIYAQAEQFTEVLLENQAKELIKLHQAGEFGHIYTIEVFGYKDIIRFMLGINPDGTISKYVVVSFDDTPGIGDRVINEPFLSSMNGKSITDKIDTISGATISSSAIVAGIKSALLDYKSRIGGKK